MLSFLRIHCQAYNLILTWHHWISSTNKSSVINILINDSKLHCIILWKLGQRLTVKPCSPPNSNFAQASENRSTSFQQSWRPLHGSPNISTVLCIYYWNVTFLFSSSTYAVYNGNGGRFTVSMSWLKMQSPAYVSGWLELKQEPCKRGLKYAIGGCIYDMC